MQNSFNMRNMIVTVLCISFCMQTHASDQQSNSSSSSYFNKWTIGGTLAAVGIAAGTLWWWKSSSQQNVKKPTSKPSSRRSSKDNGTSKNTTHSSSPTRKNSKDTSDDPSSSPSTNSTAIMPSSNNFFSWLSLTSDRNPKVKPFLSYKNGVPEANTWCKPITEMFKNGDRVSLQSMIDGKADFTQLDNQGNTPVFLAAVYIKSEEFFKLFFSYVSGESIKVKNFTNLTPMHIACQAHNENFILYACKENSPTHSQVSEALIQQDNNGNTSLHIASQNSLHQALGSMETVLNRDKFRQKTYQKKQNHDGLTYHQMARATSNSTKPRAPLYLPPPQDASENSLSNVEKLD